MVRAPRTRAEFARQAHALRSAGRALPRIDRTEIPRTLAGAPLRGRAWRHTRPSQPALPGGDRPERVRSGGGAPDRRGPPNARLHAGTGRRDRVWTGI